MWTPYWVRNCFVIIAILFFSHKNIDIVMMTTSLVAVVFFLLMKSALSTRIFFNHPRFEPVTRLVCVDVFILCDPKGICNNAQIIKGDQLQLHFHDWYTYFNSENYCMKNLHQQDGHIVDALCAKIQKHVSEDQLQKAVVSGSVIVQAKGVHKYHVRESKLGSLDLLRKRVHITGDNSQLADVGACQLFWSPCNNNCSRLCDGIGFHPFEIYCDGNVHDTRDGSLGWASESKDFPLAFKGTNTVHVDENMVCLNISSPHLNYDLINKPLQYVNIGTAKHFQLNFNCYRNNSTRIRITRNFRNTTLEMNHEFSDSVRNLFWCINLPKEECENIGGVFNLIGTDLRIILENQNVLKIAKKSFLLSNIYVSNVHQSTLERAPKVVAENCTYFDGLPCDDNVFSIHRPTDLQKVNSKKKVHSGIIILECLSAVLVFGVIVTVIVYPLFKKHTRPAVNHVS